MRPTAQTQVDQFRGILSQLDELEACRAFMGRQKYYLVAVPDTGDPEVHEFTSAEALAEMLRSYSGKRVFAFPFRGEKWSISRAPYRHLVPADGSPPIPLYCPPQDQLEPDPLGDMSDHPEPEAIPATPTEGQRGLDM